MRLALLAALVLVAPASDSAAGGEPDLRPLAQASTKSALGDTKLPEDVVSDVYADVQSFTHEWTRTVLQQGNSAAVRANLRDMVDQGMRAKLLDRGIAITQQEAVIDAMRLRAEAALQDFDRMTAAQAEVKRALEASGTKEPALSELFEEIKDFAGEAHAWVLVPGVATVERDPASLVVDDEIGPLLDEAEVPAKHRGEILKALAAWLEARASLEGEARR